MSYMFCNKHVNGRNPLQNTLLTNAEIINECEYHISYNVLVSYGGIVNKNLIPEIGHTLNELIRLGIIKSFEYTMLSDFKGPEIIIYCHCDHEQTGE